MKIADGRKFGATVPLSFILDRSYSYKFLKQYRFRQNLEPARHLFLRHFPVRTKRKGKLGFFLVNFKCQRSMDPSSLSQKHLPEPVREFVWFYFHMQYLAQNPDKFRCICSQPVYKLADCMQIFRLFLGQCASRDLTWTTTYKKLDGIHMQIFRLFLGQCVSRALTSIKSWMAFIRRFSDYFWDSV